MRDFSDPFASESTSSTTVNDRFYACWVSLILMIPSKFLTLEFHAPDRFVVHLLICEGRI